MAQTESRQRLPQHDQIGTRLRVRREDRGLSIRQLAELAGMKHHGYIDRIETRGQQPSLDILARLAGPLGFNKVSDIVAYILDE